MDQKCSSPGQTRDISQEAREILLSLVAAQGENSKSANGEAVKSHKFWSTQPVPQPGTHPFLTYFMAGLELSGALGDGPIQSEPTLEMLKSPAPLPSDFEWVSLDVDTTSDLTDLYSLLREHYVEDPDQMFRFDYQPSFLKWALQPPGWKSSWHVGVRVASSRRLVAFISAVPIVLRVRERGLEAAEVNFLCVHKSLRAKRLAPVLIREVTRRVNQCGIFQAIYTAGIRIPEPVSLATYYHRPLNYRKLLDCNFCTLPIDKSVSKMESLFHLPKGHRIPRLEELKVEDVPLVTKNLNDHLEKFKLSQKFSESEASHWLLPREDCVHSFVSKCVDGSISGFVSFYSIPTTVIGKTSVVKAAYLYYHYANDQNELFSLIQAALIVARNMGFDVFNALDVTGNISFLQNLGFVKGDGLLYYYLFNWKTSRLESCDNGFLVF